MKLILHVGCEKTGSTSLQSALTIARAALNDRGVLFPVSPGERAQLRTNHAHLVAAAMNDGVRDTLKAHYLASRGITEAEFRARFLAGLDAELERFGGDTVILSTELIHSRLVRPGEIERLFSFFEGRFDDIQMAAVLRRQDRLAISRFSSLLRDGYTDFDGIFKNAGDIYYVEGKGGVDERDYYDFRRLIERFLPFVEKQNIAVGDFDQMVLGGNLLPNTLKLLGLPSDFVCASPKASNPSMSVEAQYVLTKVNEHGPIWYPSGARNQRFKRLQRRIESTVKGAKRQVSQEEAKQFLEQFKESNAWIAEQFLGNGKPFFDDNFAAGGELPDFQVTPELEKLTTGFVDQAKSLRMQDPLESRLKGMVKAKSGSKPDPDQPPYKARYHGMPTSLQKLPRPFQWKVYTYGLRKKNTLTVSNLKRPQNAGGPIVVGRILGNDHYPRHGEGQSIMNLKFILENEPDHDRIKKLFVSNRIVDKARESEMTEMVKSAGHEILHIPFKPDAFQTLGWQADLLKRQDVAERVSDPDQELPDRLRLWLCAPKMRYLMNVNGARNATISRGLEIGNWAFPLDGNCIFTQAGMDTFVREFDAGQHAPYVVLPMERLGNNADYFTKPNASKAIEEPQIGFHTTASNWFDDSYPYGILDKAHLLMALGVPGPWLKWGKDAWVPKVPTDMPHRFRYRTSSSFVLRLAGGAQKRQIDTEQKLRYQSRNDAIFRTLRWAVENFGSRDREMTDRILGGQHE